MTISVAYQAEFKVICHAISMQVVDLVIYRQFYGQQYYLIESRFAVIFKPNFYSLNPSC